MKRFLTLFVVLLMILHMALMNPTLATHSADVAWIKEPPILSYAPQPGAPNEYFWNGQTAKWINFTVKNNGPDAIKEIKIVFQKDTPGNSLFNFSQTSQNVTGWYAVPDEFGPNKRPTVLYFRADSNDSYLQVSMTAQFDLYMTGGPDECRHDIDVWTVDAGSTGGTNYYELFIIIDRHLPKVEIIKPANGTVFQRGETVRIEAKASDSDGPHLSRIKLVKVRVEYIVKPGSLQPLPHVIGLAYDPAKDLYYWQGTDSVFQNEAWHNITAIAIDYAENRLESASTMFFWYIPVPKGQVRAYTTDSCFLKDQPVGHVGSNVMVYPNIETGFLPYQDVNVTFADTLVGHGKTDAWGTIPWCIDFNVPERPRGTYVVNVTDGKKWSATDFTIVPWMGIDKTEGFAGDHVTVTGTGFAANVRVEVIYRDVSFGAVYQGLALEYLNTSSIGFGFEWSPYLGNLTVGSATTDSKGGFTLTFNIPESYGGLHPIFAREVVSGVRSGWMPAYPQATFFKVNTKAWTDVTVGLSGQYINLMASGLPLPRYYNATFDCKDRSKKATVDNHNWTLVIDFGPNKQWVFEKGFILNNEFDFAWAIQMYLPFAYYHSIDDPNSPVWNGTLCWQDADEQYHEGSRFLKVPALMPGNYSISVYQFNKETGHDERQFEADQTFTVLKDPLYVRVTTGSQHFEQEVVKIYVEIDVDGMAIDPTELTVDLHRDEGFLQSLTATRMDTGLYTTSFVPQSAGDYMVKVNATKRFETFTLSGSGILGFTVNPARARSSDGDGGSAGAMVGDITGPDGWPDGKCDMRDIGVVARNFGQAVPPANSNCDLTGPTVGVPDGKIDMHDIGLVARNFGKTRP